MNTGTLSLVRGDDQDITLNVKHPDGITLYDLTGCSLVFTVRKNTYYSEVIFTLSAVLTDPTNGIAVLNFISSNTSEMNDLPYFYDIKLTNALSKIATLLSGTLYIRPK